MHNVIHMITFAFLLTCIALTLKIKNKIKKVFNTYMNTIPCLKIRFNSIAFVYAPFDS